MKKTGYMPVFSYTTSTRGFEPPTYRLGGGRSILLSYADNRRNAFFVLDSLTNETLSVKTNGSALFCPEILVIEILDRLFNRCFVKVSGKL